MARNHKQIKPNTMTNTQTQTELTLKEANKLTRQEARKEAKRLAKIEAEKNQKPVKEITFSIEWSKSFNPTLEARAYHVDGSTSYVKARAGGWGYCKESTVIAEAFNSLVKYKLYELVNIPSDFTPYGVYINRNGYTGYAGGIGVSCYYSIAELIGGKFEKLASGKSFDAYKLTLNN
jgi:hypothetical protein